MAEHTIEKNPQSALLALRKKQVEVLFSSQSRIDCELVQGVVSVARRKEKRAKEDA